MEITKQPPPEKGEKFPPQLGIFPWIWYDLVMLSSSWLNPNGRWEPNEARLLSHWCMLK